MSSLHEDLKEKCSYACLNRSLDMKLGSLGGLTALKIKLISILIQN